jgi:cytochrome c2
MNRDKIIGVLTDLLAAAAVALLPPLLVGKPFWGPRSPGVLLLALSSIAYLCAALPLLRRDRTGVARVLLCGLAAFGAAFAAFALVQWRWPQAFGTGFPADVAFAAIAFGLVTLLALSAIRGGAWWKLAVTAVLAGAALAVHVSLRLEVKPPDREVSYLDTSLLVLKVSRYRRWIADDGARGGAIAAFGKGYLVAGGDGGLAFIREQPEGEGLDVQKLAYRVPVNEAEFARDARRLFEGAWPDNSIHRLRVGDLVVQRRAGGIVRLFVAHHAWKPAESCYVLRVSMLEGSEAQLLAPTEELRWKSLYDTSPCLALNTGGHRGLRFGGLQLGGSLAFIGEDELLLAVGDHEFDGFTRNVAMPQDRANAYGKIIAIHIDTGASRIYSLGHRNPEGLYAGPDGAIWSTEHGPRGGDELNRIREGADYGWPTVTYGTDYALHTWPFNPVQGRHEGFEKPLLAFVPSIAISEVIAVTGERFAPWRGDLLVASMLDGLRRVRLEDGRAVLVERFPIAGRLRDMAEGNDGKIALWTDDNHIIIVEPAPESGGEALILVCASCHTLGAGEPSSLGPNLAGVFGRRVASAADYDYSLGMKAYGGRWTRERLERFLENPRVTVPGTTMEFEGIEDAAQRRAIVDYLERSGD